MRHYPWVYLWLAVLLAGCAGSPDPASPDPRRESPRPELLETYWLPVEIDGKPVVIQPGAREPHIVLMREGKVTGNTGCNSLGGVFRQSADGLRLEKLVMTRRACVAAEANALESAFVRALESTVSQRVAGDMLELRDAVNVVRMRLKAGSPR